MSKRSNITADDHWFIGEDKLLAFVIVDEDDHEQDVGGFVMEWVLRRNSRDQKRLIVKTSAAGLAVEIGDVLASRVVVSIEDVDTLSLLPGKYEHALRRTDVSHEGVLSFGTALLQMAAAR